MSKKDFDYLVIASEKGWRQGRGESVRVDEQGRLSLSPQKEILLPEEVIERPLGLPLDCNGNRYQGKELVDAKPVTLNKLTGIGFDWADNLYLIDGDTCRLYRYSPRAETLDAVNYIGGCGGQPGQFGFLSPDGNAYSGRIAFGKSTLYVSDTFNHRLQAFYLPSFQVRFTLGEGWNPSQQAFGVDPVQLCRPTEVLVNKKGKLYVLDSGNDRILMLNKYGIATKVIGSSETCGVSITKPISMAIDQEGYLYVLDAIQCTVLKFDENGNFCGAIGSFLETNPQIRPTTIAVDRDKLIYVGDGTRYSASQMPSCDSEGQFRIHQFDRSGRYLGYRVSEGECRQLTTDHGGKLYGLCGDPGRVVDFAGGNHFLSHGIHRSNVLDSRIPECKWHRVMLDGGIPERTQLQVYCYASDDPIDPNSIDPQLWQLVLSSPYKSIETKDALFDEVVGRYLVLRFELSGDGNGTPTIKMARVYFQRDSYLRYLPATYQEDERGRKFLERFLSIFESMVLELEDKIAHVTQYWDVTAVDEEFLEWLGTWLAVATDENWTERKKRELLAEAFELYKARGTLDGLRRIIQIFTGGEVQIIEHFRLRPPMVIGQASILGLSTFVGPQPTQRLVLGQSSKIGAFVLSETEDAPEKPFERDAYDFTVLVEPSRLKDESQEQTLRRLIGQEAPAHTRFFLRTNRGGAAQLGKHSLLGVDTLLAAGYESLRLGKNSIIGTATPLGRRYCLKGTLGIRSRVAVDTVLN